MNDIHKKIAKLDRLAIFLDSKFRIPYTQFKIGADSIIGLFPVYGDLLSLLLSLYVVLMIARMGVPPSVLMRVCANSLLDFVIGVIPFVGDFADIFFKSNLKNVRLAKDYFSQPQKVSRQSWFIIIGFFTLIIGVFVASSVLVVWLGSWILDLIRN